MVCIGIPPRIADAAELKVLRALCFGLNADIVPPFIIVNIFLNQCKT